MMAAVRVRKPDIVVVWPSRALVVPVQGRAGLSREEVLSGMLTRGTRSVHKASTIVHTDPEILGGTPVFVGTRVPVRILFEHLAAGDSVDTFLDAFPSVRREQAVAVLDLAEDLVTDRARSSG